MLLRVVLVALVAGLGVDFSGNGEFGAWAASGRAWASATLADLAAWGPLGDPASPAEAAPMAPAEAGRADLAFETVMEGTTTRFAGDLAANRSEAPAANPAVAAEPAREVASVEPEESPSDRAERVEAALRLTRQAVDAWASLIRPPPEAVERDDTL